MSKKTRIILNIVLGIVLIGCIIGLVFWSIHCWELDHNMFLKEYNAQMDKFGYYKKDIQLFDHCAEETRFIWCLIGNVVGWVVAVGAILANILCGLYNAFDAFN